MAKPAQQQQKQQPAKQPAAPTFKIEDGKEIPSRTKDVPEYNIPFASMKEGQSILLRFADVPLAHARLLVMRYSRKEKVEMPTRTEKDANGDAIGLRVWRGAAQAE